ncbi:MAG TPA: hypothetical protein GXZ98_06615 [Firmicutes bacterium]|nr:hypothetical protein [Bacillota bacterium]
MEYISTKNIYGFNDLTPYNVLNHIIKYDWIKIDSISDYNLSPHDVIEQATKLGIKITIRTLQRRTDEELVPQPYRTSAGRGVGKVTLYRGDTPAELYAAEKLKKILNVQYEDVSKIRQITIQENMKTFWVNIFKRPDFFAAYAWLKLKAKALDTGFPIFINWRLIPAWLSPSAKREIKLEQIASSENLPDEFDFIEIINPVTLTEDETPNFDKWWDVIKKIEANK